VSTSGGWEGRLYFYPTQDVRYDLTESSITWAEYSSIGSTSVQPYCCNLSTRPSLGGSYYYDYHYQIFAFKAPDAAACTKMTVSYQAKLWGASSASTYTGQGHTASNGARYYWQARQHYAATTCTLVSASFTDALNTRTFTYNKSVSYHTLGNMNYINMGDLTYTWATLTNRAAKVTAVPKARTYSTVNRKYWLYASYPTNTIGNILIKNLYDEDESVYTGDIVDYLYDIISWASYTPPSNWNSTSGTASSATLLNASWSMIPLSYVAYVYTANQYTYSSTSYAPTLIISMTSASYSN
jgi:hypothetical protein